MTTASHTMIARAEGHEQERRGLTMIAVGALVLMLSIAAQVLLPHALADTTHEIQ